jgi:hypothetical protein
MLLVAAQHKNPTRRHIFAIFAQSRYNAGRATTELVL